VNIFCGVSPYVAVGGVRGRGVDGAGRATAT
jgi:hypothetical protein